MYVCLMLLYGFIICPVELHKSLIIHSHMQSPWHHFVHFMYCSTNGKLSKGYLNSYQVRWHWILSNALQRLCCKHCSGGKATGEKGPATSSNPGPTLFRRASAMSYQSQSQIFHLPSPYVPVIGVPPYNDRLKTYASRLVQCVMIIGSAGDSM